MTVATFTNVPAAKRSFSPLAWVAMAYEISRERKALAQLDNTQLDDIGVSMKDASVEANRPFWDIRA